ncbi:hypothetical protein ACFVWR_14390 [Leifsonia sp. NPDC058292]|uniref:hypothetical protein n=1 Tax=Leifsonia sp. NPDC058292 TaxID=3346428 RepID=UPI0036D97612
MSWRDRILGDAVQRQAEEHIYNDLIHLESRTTAFLRAPQNVRTQVLAELSVRAEMREAGARTPAATTFIVVVGTSATVFTALMVAVIGGFFTTLVPLVDPKTGKIHGISQEDFTQVLSTTALVVGLVALISLVAAALAWAAARTQDRQRATYKAWIEIYCEAVNRRSHLARQGRLRTASKRARE